MFGEKGVILSSAISENIKAIIAIFEDGNTGKLRPLVKIVCKRNRLSKTPKRSTQLYKEWLSTKEVCALIILLNRISVLLEEHAEGTLDLRDVLAEDEEVERFVANREPQSTENLLDWLENGYPHSDEHADKEGVKDEDPNDLF